MTDKQIIIDNYFRKIVDINGEIVDYEIKNSEVLKLVQKIEKYNSYIELKEQECKEFKKQLERKEENYQKLLSKSNKYIHNLVDENVQDISNLARLLEQFKVENEKF